MKHKILIIDDSIVNINALYIMLRESYQVYVAKNGRDGIKEAKRNEVSLILLDILMPCMDGFEVLEALKKDPLTSRIPVMFITGLHDDKEEERGLSMGAVDYITKPLNPSVIKAKIKNHIELYEYRKTIEYMAMLDGLTGIPNRRSYEKILSEYWREAGMQQCPFSIAILDIDYFKEYNDNYGHLKGDIVLKQVANALKENLPEQRAFLARYGGEEFAVLLLGYSNEEASAIVERMRTAVSDQKIEHLHSKARKIVSMSAGGITVQPKGEKPNSTVEEADKRLYWAKSSGRDRTVWKEAEHATGQMEVFMFGRIRMLSRTGEVTGDYKGKRLAYLLLSYLICNRYKEYSKETLIQAIWPDSEEKEDLAFALRTVIEEARNELQSLKMGDIRDLIVTINGCYHWNNSYMCIVDAELFENLFYESLGEKNEERLESQCEHAISLYKAEFLEKVSEVPWIVEKRKEYRRMYEALLLRLLAIRYKKKEYNEVIKLCQKELFASTFYEEVHWYYLKALIALGQYKEAAGHYEYMMESCYQKLQSQPSKKMEEIYAEIVGIASEETCSAQEIESVVKEQSIAKGAYYCDLHVFCKIYQLNARSINRNKKKYYLILIDAKRNSYVTKQKQAAYMHELYQAIMRSLRVEDIFSRINEEQYALLLCCDSAEHATKAVSRVEEAFYAKQGKAQITLCHEIHEVKEADQLNKRFHK